ncbi:MAG: hypothetical protein JRJ12_00225 [Deltaproteobacteria bacterium]|nr:hypothetical protein [Deltaproteobacteria bacterium]MBW2069790.1 hypothetical protein [Deltaproteobacteria bacterium]
MRTELIRSPTAAFLQMLLNNIRPQERKKIEGTRWGAVGLVQARLIELYWAADVAEKASNVVPVLVLGNCPQHIQMLAIFGQQAAVRTALDKIQESRRE